MHTAEMIRLILNWKHIFIWNFKMLAIFHIWSQVWIFFTINFVHPDEEFSTSKKNAFAKFAPHHVEPLLWRVIKMLLFSLFNSSSLHKFNQLSNKNALRWGVRGKECFVVWWWEFEGERENKVQRKTTIEIWLLF